MLRSRCHARRRQRPDEAWGRPLTPCGSFTMMTSVRGTLVIIGTAAYLGLAILGWGGWTAFFAHPARIALAVVLFVLAGVSLVAGGNLIHIPHPFFRVSDGFSRSALELIR